MPPLRILEGSRIKLRTSALVVIPILILSIMLSSVTQHSQREQAVKLDISSIIEMNDLIYTLLNGSSDRID